MIRIHEIKIKASEDESLLCGKIARKLKLTEQDITHFQIVKESVDARKKPDIYKVFSIELESSKTDAELLSLCKRVNIRAEEVSSVKTAVLPSSCGFKKRPVVVGFGPCGMFAALSLARMGARPLVLERGPAMDERIRAVEEFWRSGKLDPEANCQFGEGGAGTFSDGKLTTGTRSEFRMFVLEEFVKAGAAPEIMYRQKPHIGTDVLRTVVVNIRKEIESLGGELRFRCRLESVEIKDGRVSAAVLSGGERIETDCIILALGHSSRDTIRNLRALGIDMEQKNFSMGVRIEHPQSMVDVSQYGRTAGELGLGPADYKLNVRTKDGRGVYTFCMCPGGVVVNASSHEGCITTNGMSYYRRDSGKANSALLADVRSSDFSSDDPLAGMEFQEKYERLAFELGGRDYTIPTEKLGSFMTAGELKKCLPDFVFDSLREAVPMLGRKLKGFDDPDALLYAVESRSSSPVRITRNELGFALSGGAVIEGLYPAGEGAGYAGGIMSAACDGVKTAIKTAEKFGISRN